MPSDFGGFAGRRTMFIRCLALRAQRYPDVSIRISGDTAALQIKLDELIRATVDANNALLDLEEMSEEDIERYRRSYEKLAKAAAEKGIPELKPREP